MKKAVIVGERQADVVNVTDPEPKENWVVVKVHVAPMCTEYKAYTGGHQVVQLGHEAAGEVVAMAQPGRVKIGDRVTVMPQNACGACSYCLGVSISTVRIAKTLSGCMVRAMAAQPWPNIC